MDQNENILDTVLQYHQRSKHGFQQFADAPGYMDWANQPDPYRRYEGAELIRLPQRTAIKSPGYSEIYAAAATPVQVINRQSIANLFFHSLALSAVKQAGEARWALRVNPSSGNLHPTEAYLLCGAIDSLCDAPMLAHYVPEEHGLEIRCHVPLSLWQSLTDAFTQPVFFVCLTSIFWREAWKYGERAYRYCQLDLGHAIATVSLAAACLGWYCRLLPGLSQQQLRDLMALPCNDDPETEQPGCLLAISPVQLAPRVTSLPTISITAFKNLAQTGIVNRLSPDHVPWPEINAVARACEKPVTHCKVAPGVMAERIPERMASGPDAFAIIRHRRSAVAMDAKTAMSATKFYRLLQRTLPNRVACPYTTLALPVKIHLLFFVHRVTGLSPGVYLLLRDIACKAKLQQSLKPHFAWQKPKACPADLPLYQLLDGNAGDIAMQLSCQQVIAAEGCFSLGMLADFRQTLQVEGVWSYPQLYWECGVVGQVLYLEAEALGLQGTGIGCFFDDPVHDFLGLESDCFQILYHFTVGGSIKDKRLLTLPAYA